MRIARRKTWTTIVRGLWVVVLGAIGAVAIESTPAQATSYNQTYLQFNMCGGSCFGGSTSIAEATVRSINNRSPQPFIVTLNEVCENQYWYIYYRVAHYGYFDPTGAADCPNGERFGNAILLRTVNRSYINSWGLPTPYGGEPRRLMCARATLAGAEPMVACVTHISNIANNAGPQISRVAQIVNPYWNGNGVLVGGDFNMDPYDRELNVMYSSAYPNGTGLFNEVDASPSFSRSQSCYSTTYNESTHGCRKLDYIFISRIDWTNWSGDATYSDSDHDPLWGSARFWY